MTLVERAVENLIETCKGYNIYQYFVASLLGIEGGGSDSDTGMMVTLLISDVKCDLMLTCPTVCHSTVTFYSLI